MNGRRYNLPHLAFLQGFEAAARTLSFTKAAEELFVTQSAVSRQIKALEDNLGLRLFERRSRSLALTENGQALYRIATDVFDWLQTATDRLRAETRARQLAITTTTGFASLWLIPRLRRFTALHPDIDVRLSATTDALNLERSLIDVAIRYCRPEAVPEGAVRLFGEEMIPVCSRAAARQGAAAQTAAGSRSSYFVAFRVCRGRSLCGLGYLAHGARRRRAQTRRRAPLQPV